MNHGDFCCKAWGRPILGIDPGKRRWGLARSDPRWRIAVPLLTLERVKFSLDVERILQWIEQEQIGGLVIGLPVNMDGSEGPRAKSSRTLARLMERDARLPPTILWDERLSTRAVSRMLDHNRVSAQKKAKRIDAEAAAFILQGALDGLRRRISDQDVRNE